MTSATDTRGDDAAGPRRSSLLRSSAIMASGTLVSRITGLLRSVLLIAAIGSAAGGVSGAFQTANTLPNTVYNLLAAGVFDAVLVPQIVRALKARGGDAYVNKLLTLAGTILFGVTLLAMVLSPLLVIITASGLSSGARTLAILFALLCLPQIFFYGLYNLLGELLNARGIFGPYMWAPVVNNVIAIAGLGTFLALWGSSGDVLAVGDFSSTQFWVLTGSTTLGVVAQALVLILPMRANRVPLRLDFHFRGTSFGAASKVAGWTFATLGVSQVGVLSTTNLASQVEGWAAAHSVPGLAGTAAYSTAFMIYMVPQSLISVTLATAIFTRLATAVAERDEAAVARDYHTGVGLITMLSLVSAAILMAGAVPMMQMVLFNNPDVSMAHTYAGVLVALMPGVASTGMVLMSQRVFFAYEDARPVFVMGIVPTILQVVVSWSFFLLAEPRLWVVGAALGETTCRLVQGFIAVIWVARRNRHVNPGRIIASYVRFFLAAAVAYLAAWLVLRLVGVDTVVGSGALRFLVALLRLTLVALVALATYVGVLRLVDPTGTARILSMVAARIPLPGALRRVLVGGAGAAAALPGDNGVRTTRTGGAMDEEQGREGDSRATGAEPGGRPIPPESESLAAEDTGWAMIGRSWSAADPTHTGEFPVVSRVPGGADQGRIPSFAEILHPGSEGGGHAGGGEPPEHVSPAATEWRIGHGPAEASPTPEEPSPAGASTPAAVGPTAASTSPDPWDAVPEVWGRENVAAAGTGDAGPDEFPEKSSEETITSTDQTRGRGPADHDDPGHAAGDESRPDGDAGPGEPPVTGEDVGGTPPTWTAVTSGLGGPALRPAPIHWEGAEVEGAPPAPSWLRAPGDAEATDDSAEAGAGTTGSSGTAGTPGATGSTWTPGAPAGTRAGAGAGASRAAAAGAAAGLNAGAAPAAGVSGAAASGAAGTAASAGAALSAGVASVSASLTRFGRGVLDSVRSRPDRTSAARPTGDHAAATPPPPAPPAPTARDRWDLHERWDAHEGRSIEDAPLGFPQTDTGPSPTPVSSDAATTSIPPFPGESPSTTTPASAPRSPHAGAAPTRSWSGIVHGAATEGTWSKPASERAVWDATEHHAGTPDPWMPTDAGADTPVDGDGPDAPTRAVPPSSFLRDVPPAPPAPPSRPGGGGGGRGRRIDPTRPALVFGVLTLVIGLAWSVSELSSPVTGLNFAQSLQAAQSAAQSGAQSGAATPAPTPTPTPTSVAPTIQSATVYSWNDDGGDNEDSAINMIDGDPKTQWHSRWYDYNQFAPDSTVTVLLKLDAPSTVTSLTLQLDPTTSGGQMVVRSVDPNTTDPRQGTELTTTALSPTTTITFDQPVETQAISLSFTSMPTSVDGNPWVWIYEVGVK